jgi:hypothetical protein
MLPVVLLYSAATARKTRLEKHGRPGSSSDARDACRELGVRKPQLPRRHTARVTELEMAVRIYVGNLPYQATEDGVRELFAGFGTVQTVRLITDRETGRPRGFGFVEMAEGGESAIGALDGKDFGGRRLYVNEARPREAGGREGGGSRDMAPGRGSGVSRDPGPSRDSGPSLDAGPSRDGGLSRDGGGRDGYRDDSGRGSGGGSHRGGYRDDPGFRDGGYRDSGKGRRGGRRDDY